MLALQQADGAGRRETAPLPPILILQAVLGVVALAGALLSGLRRAGRAPEEHD